MTGACSAVAILAIASFATGCADVLNLEDSYSLVPPAGYAAEVMSDSPLSYWRLDELPAATTAKNEVAGGPEGTVFDDVVFGVPGLWDGYGAAKFATGNAKLTFGKIYAFPGRSSFSIEVWANPSALSPQGFLRMVSNERCCEVDTRHGIGLSLSSTGVYIQRLVQDQGVKYDTAGTAIIGTNIFTHIVGTYDGDREQICLYIDGRLDECRAAPHEVVRTNLNFTLGGYPELSNGFGGTLDEVAIYDYALSADRVAAHYAAVD